MTGQAALETIDSRIDSTEAATIAAEQFGVIAQAQTLAGERDQNFLLTAGASEKRVLKISNSAEDPLVTDLQTKALLHLEEAAAAIPVPRLIRTRNGEAQASVKSKHGALLTVRLLTFLEGEQLHAVTVDDALLKEIGIVLAQLDLALSGFRHPAETHDLLWDVQHALLVRPRLDAIAAASDRDLAAEALDIFEQRAAQVLPSLPAQLIHNDFNPHNLLVGQDRKVAGILDLGDAVRAPRIVDVAVASAYHLRDDGDPLEGVAALVKGYHSVAPLTAAELEILCPLIAARLAMTIAITNWRATRHPENRDYILKNVPAAQRGLRELLKLDLNATPRRLWDGITQVAA